MGNLGKKIHIHHLTESSTFVARLSENYSSIQIPDTMLFAIVSMSYIRFVDVIVRYLPLHVILSAFLCVIFWTLPLNSHQKKNNICKRSSTIQISTTQINLFSEKKKMCGTYWKATIAVQLIATSNLFAYNLKYFFQIFPSRDACFQWIVFKL